MLVVVAREGDLTGDELVQLRTGAILSDGRQLFLSLSFASFSHLRPARLDSRLSVSLRLPLGLIFFSSAAVAQQEIVARESDRSRLAARDERRSE